MTTARSARLGWATLGLLALVVLGTRFPFFFRYVIDWDESSYVLVAQSLRDGHLPYTELWDAKPPLAFAIIAAFLMDPDAGIVTLRLGGALLVFVSAVAVHAIARRIGRPGGATPTALLFVVGCAATKSGQATMMELVALPFLLLAVLLLLDDPLDAKRAGLVGVLIALAAMVRLNLALVALPVGLWLLARSARLIVPYAACGLAVLGTVALPYWISGKLPLLWGSCFAAGVAHSGSGIDLFFGAVYALQVTLGLHHAIGIDNTQLALALLVWLPAGLGGWLAFRRHRLGLLGVVIAGVGLSMALAGWFYEHHTLQLLPFACLLALETYERITSRRWRIALGAWVVVTTGLAMQDVAREGLGLLRRAGSEKLMTGPAGELADYLRDRCGPDCSVFLLTDHLGYWLLDKPLPTKLAHPAMIMAPYVYAVPGMRSASPEEELRAIFAQEPTFVVRSVETEEWWLDDTGEDLVLPFLERRYERVFAYGPESDVREVWRRIDD